MAMTTTQKADLETTRKDHLKEIKFLLILSVSILLYKIFNYFGESETLHIYPLNAGKFTTLKNYAMFISYHFIFALKLMVINWVNNHYIASPRITKTIQVLIAMVVTSFLFYILGGYLIYKEIIIRFNEVWMGEYKNLFLAYDPQWPWRRWHYFMYLAIHLTDLAITVWLYDLSKKHFSKIAGIICQGFIVFIALRIFDFVMYAGQVNIPLKVALLTGWMVFVLYRYIGPKYLLDES